MPPWFTPRRVLWLLIAGLATAFVGYGCYASRQPAADCNAYCQSIIAAHSRQLAADRDVARAASVAAETVYVAAKKKADVAVGQVPPVTVSGDTITFADDSSFAIPHRVALLIVSQRDAIAAQDSALTAADELLAKFRVERRATDSLLAGVTQENVALAQQVRALTPGRLGRFVAAVRTPLTFVAGVAVGAYAVSRVVR
jgi:hypothetical protein